MDRKYQVLKQHFGYSNFRSGQEDLIDAQMAGRDVFGVIRRCIRSGIDDKTGSGYRFRESAGL